MTTSTSDVQIVRMPTVYGHCDCIKAMRDGEQIASAERSGLIWLIGISGRDDFNLTYRMELSPASDSNTAITAKSRDEIYADVEALLLRQIARYDAVQFGRAA
jgi:hypothetical protein